MVCVGLHLRKLAMSLCAIGFCAVLGACPLPAGSVEAGLPTLAPLVKRISPSVVSLVSTKHADDSPRPVDPIEGFPDAPLARNMLGSGVILDAALGLIVTANHVIDNA